jgi:hypothetical protein
LNGLVEGAVVGEKSCVWHETLVQAKTLKDYYFEQTASISKWKFFLTLQSSGCVSTEGSGRFLS